MNTTLFTDDNQEIIPTFDPEKDYVAEYLTEGGKFYDPDPEIAKKKLARAKAEADHTIKLRELEQAQLRKDYLSLREEYDAVPKLQELVAQLASGQLTSNNHTPVNEDPSKPAINLDDIESLIEKREAQKREQANLEVVQNKLVDRYGPNYNTHLKHQREQLGMSAAEVDHMAKTNPKAFERLFLSTPAGETFQAPPASSQRTDTFAPKTQQKDWQYYESMRKTNPTLYWDPKTINQMHTDRKAMGTKFYG
jgi:hypothetical protein